MRSRRSSLAFRLPLAGALLAASIPASVGAGTGSVEFTVHGVTQIVTDPLDCTTRLEIGFRVEIGDLPLSNGHLDETTVNASTMTVDGAAAAGYAAHTDFAVAPFYFANLDVGPLAPGAHELLVVGGPDGLQWRAFNHAEPEQPFAALLPGDYRLSFIVPPCGDAVPVTFSAFAPPVDPGPLLNLIERGDTVPIRFSAARGSMPMNDPSEFSVTVTRAACTRTDPVDPVERVVQPIRTGELFHDPMSSEFVYRWTAVSGRHPCWHVSFVHESGASMSAAFRLWGR